MKGMLKKIIIFVVVFILIVILVKVVGGKKDSGGSLTSSAEDVDTSLLGEGQSEVADEFLNTLLNLNTITLEGSVFSDPRFTSLVDYTVALTPQPLGRSNPFLPVGSTSVTTTTIVDTTAGTETTEGF
jgi:hypothetical protein